VSDFDAEAHIDRALTMVRLQEEAHDEAFAAARAATTADEQRDHFERAIDAVISVHELHGELRLLNELSDEYEPDRASAIAAMSEAWRHILRELVEIRRIQDEPEGTTHKSRRSEARAGLVLAVEQELAAFDDALERAKENAPELRVVIEHAFAGLVLCGRLREVGEDGLAAAYETTFKDLTLALGLEDALGVRQ
jgi:hypothetical protein